MDARRRLPPRTPGVTNPARLWASREIAGLRLLAVALAPLLTGCRACTDDGDKQGSSSVAPGFPSASFVRSDVQTTDARTAMSELESQVSAARKGVKDRPDSLDQKRRLASLLLIHARVVGSPADLGEAIQIGEAALAASPDDMDALLLHVHVRAAGHRFNDALAELDALDLILKRNHVPRDTTRGERAALFVAMGRYDDAKPIVDSLVANAATTENLTLRAVLLADTGNVDDAEKQFIDAEAAFTGTSPFSLVDLYFERASMWERAGDLGKATSIFGAAHDRLPQHSHVATHLAALLPAEDAVKLLRPVAESSGDPEVAAALSVYENFAKDGAGDADLARAKAGYDELAKTLPEAYADHAGWFWLNVAKAPDKAFVAATTNLVQRQDADAYELAIAAALAAGKRSEACAIAEKAHKFPYPSRRLTEQLRLVGDCGGASTEKPAR